MMLLVALCGIMTGINMSAQTYLRYVKPEDLGTRAVYADSVLSSIVLPKGVAKLYNYPKFNVAALELSQILNDPTKELMQVYVCGSTSPDGLWGDNVKLSEARTEAAASYLMSILDIPSYKIHKESLNEDWDRLYELVAESDMPYKYNVMTIIRSMDWGARKKALQALDGGRAWDILERDFFPQLRCVRFAIFCKWDPTKPYMAIPQAEQVAPAAVPETPVPQSKADTVYVRDTVYYVKETVLVPQHADTAAIDADAAYQGYRNARRARVPRKPELWDTPWLIGLKTNLIADAMVIPSFGLEFQIGKKLSLDLQGWYTNYNVFCKGDPNTNVYGFTPEIRWWSKGAAMERGSFFGVHARTAWYTMQWRDGYLYQNGAEDQYDSDAGNVAPAWSIGLTYGYSFALDRKAHWGLELVLGIGYGTYRQNLGRLNEEDNTWYIHEHQDNTHIGITRAGVNLTYRFSVRRVNPEYYNNNLNQL